LPEQPPSGQAYSRDISYSPSLAIIRGAAPSQTYNRDITYSTTLGIIRGEAPSQAYRRDLTYSTSLAIIRGQAPGQFKRDITYSPSLGIIWGAAPPQFNIGYSPSLGIICDQCRPGGGDGDGGGGDGRRNGVDRGVIIPGDRALSFALMLAIIGVPALLLASAAGPPGLFVGLLIGGAMAFIAGLLPLWLIVLLALAMIMLIAFMIRGRQE